MADRFEGRNDCRCANCTCTDDDTCDRCESEAKAVEELRGYD
ncbi:MAG: hypothetical protein WC683_04890 [bacterium]